VQRHFALVEVGPDRRQLARRVDDRRLAIVCAHDAFQHRQQSVRTRQLDEPPRRLDALLSLLVVAPDEEQLERDDARSGRVDAFVEGPCPPRRARALHGARRPEDGRPGRGAAAARSRPLAPVLLLAGDGESLLADRH
jgi:hypothetical protein